MDWFVFAIIAGIICFLFFLNRKKQTDREFALKMMSAPAEENSRSKVEHALSSVGVQLPSEPDNTNFCIEASAAIVEQIMKRAGKDLGSATPDDVFSGGIFAFVVSNHLTRLIDVEFELVATYLPIKLFGDDATSVVSEIGNAYNKMSQEGRVIEAIGQNIALWIENPTDEKLDKLAKLYELCKDNVS